MVLTHLIIEFKTEGSAKFYVIYSCFTYIVCHQVLVPKYGQYYSALTQISLFFRISNFGKCF